VFADGRVPSVGSPFSASSAPILSCSMGVAAGRRRFHVSLWYDLLMIRPFIIGFATTLKHFFKKPITVNYPEQKIPVYPKYRGKQVLMRDEMGLEKCVACGLCAVACPADAIYLEAAENDGSIKAGPRYAKVYQIHKTRCIFCGYCEEACPVSAIFMGKDYELAVYSNKDFIWDKQDLLVPDTVGPTASARGPREATE
jgi:NADH-quinone oxidoreductase subunit I